MKKNTSSRLAPDVDCLISFWEASSSHDFLERRVKFVKFYKALSEHERFMVVQTGVNHIKARFKEMRAFDDIILYFLSAWKDLKDWKSVNFFLDAILIFSSLELKECVVSFFEVSDNGLQEGHGESQLALVILTQLGLRLASDQKKLALDVLQVSGLVEYITSSLLARSNVNHNAIRLALINFLAERHDKAQMMSLQLTRIIGRFGQSLLEELLTMVFENKDKSNAAFHYLTHYLDVFFRVSPSIAQMTHDMLRHYMFRFPDEFPFFIEAYIQKSSFHHKFFVMKHVSMLFLDAIQVSKKDLAESLLSVLYSFYRSCEKEGVSMNQIDSVLFLLFEPALKRGGSLDWMVKDFFDKIKGTSKVNYKNVMVSSKKANIGKKGLKFKVGEEPNPLDSMFLLVG